MNNFNGIALIVNGLIVGVRVFTWRVSGVKCMAVLASILSAIVLVFCSICILRSIISIIGIIAKSYSRVWVKPGIKQLNPHRLVDVLIVIPLYLECKRDIEVVLESIARQVYPKDHIMVVIVVEEGDRETLSNVYSVLCGSRVIRSIRDRVIVLKKPPPRTSKASAVNYAVKTVNYGSVVCILDGGDILKDRYHIARAVTLVNEGYDIIGSQVLRVGSSIIGKLSYLDTLVWVKIGLPSTMHILGVPLVSGEGLFIRRDVLERIGGLPQQILAEDAYLAIPVFNYNFKVGFLASRVYESTPANIANLVKQRLRWYRGHLQCLKLALESRGISLVGKVKLILAYSSPIVVASIAIAYTYVALTLVTSTYSTIPLALSLLVIVSTYTAPLYILGITPRRLRKILILLPLYWLFLSVISVLTLIPTLKIEWYKTVRSRHPLHYKLARAT